MPKRVYASRGRVRKAIYKKRPKRVRRINLRRTRRPRIGRGLPLTGFPRTTIARLRYGDSLYLNASATVPAKQIIVANSCYKPDFLNAGHQPRGFDQMMLVYNHCTIIGSKIRAMFVNPGNTNVIPGNIGVALSAGAEFVTTNAFIDTLENKYVSRPRLHGTLGLTGVGANSVVITKKFSAKKFFGKKTIVGDSLYRHNDSSNPSEMAFFELFQYPNSSGNDPDPIIVEFIVDYICVFTEPKILPRS